MFHNGMHYRVWGDGTKTALLLHGFASSSITWKKLAKDLVTQGYTVVAPDLKGHGKSERNKKYSMHDWSNDILSLNLNPDLIIGHSMGGLIAANIQPKLKAQKVVLIDPVYNLPKDKLMLTSIQTVFKTTLLLRKYVNPTLPKNKRSEGYREEYINLRRWDHKTVHALRPNKKSIVQCLLGSTEILLMRAKDSFIVPTHIMQRQYNDNILLKYFDKTGHNIHQDAYEDFWSTVNTFVNNQKDLIHNVAESLLLPTKSLAVDQALAA